MFQEKEQEWVKETLERTAGKLEKVSRRSAHKIPYTVKNGVHDDRSGEKEIGWWTNGFWGGMMWQLYALTGQEDYLRIARENERKLDICLMDYGKLDHDNGFKWLPTAVADYRATKDPAARNRGLLAASHLAGRYNCAGRFLRAWNDGNDGIDRTGWAIIDCMMNLPLLYWASEETADPRFRQIAENHADTAARCFVRPDGSVNHIVEFDPQTGEMLGTRGGQGCEEGSSWTRGQSWGLYGFTLSYIHTGKEAYLRTAERIADYFLENIPESGLIPVDFRQPKEVRLEDSTAAAIASCGLIELAGRAEREKRKAYLDAALRLMHALTQKRVNWNEEEDDLLLKCTAAYHDAEHEFSIIYGDYFYLEALMKLAGKELFLW